MKVACTCFEQIFKSNRPSIGRTVPNTLDIQFEGAFDCWLVDHTTREDDLEDDVHLSTQRYSCTQL